MKSRKIAAGEVRLVIKKHFVFILEGAVYGFFGGALLWTSLYLIYETYISILRSELVGEISISYLSFPVEFSRLCLFFMVLASVIRLIIEFFFQKYNDLLLSWLLTGMISVVVINLILSSEPVPLLPESVGYGWLCCIDNSSGYLLWPITFFLVALYSFLFVSARNAFLQYSGKNDADLK